jgi:RND family efflux transporter MFP subunit
MKFPAPTSFHQSRRGLLRAERRRAPLKRRIFITVVGTVALALTAGQIVRAATNREANPDPRVAIQTVEIAKAVPVSSFDSAYTGIIGAQVLSPTGFRVAGKIIKRYVDKGQTVKKGDPLMSLDPTDFDLSATAATQQAQASEAIKTQAEADRTRFAAVVGGGAVSQQKFDAATATADASDANVRAAKAQAQIAANARSYTTLYAEADGIIVDTLAEPGQVMPAGQPVVQMAFRDAPEAVINLPETVFLEPGARATAYLMGDESTPHPAHLRQLAAQADPVLRTFEARFPLDDDVQQARLGSTVTIKLSHRVDWMRIPVRALVNRGQGYAVWILDPATSTVSEHAVQVERITETAALVSAGLNPGEEVVAAGAHRFTNGEKIFTPDNQAGRP